MRRIISFFLLIAILIVEASPNTVFATENNIAKTEEEALELLRRNNNFAKLERVAEILSSQSTEMETHVWIGDALYAVYKTDDPKVKLTLSGTEFQVVEYVNDSTFLIDGEEMTISIEVRQDHVPAGYRASWLEISDPGGSWTYDGSYDINVALNNAISNFTIGVLATVLGFVAGNQTGGLICSLVSIASGVISVAQQLADPNLSVVKIRRHVYKNGSLYKKTVDEGYVKYNNNYYLADSGETHYFSWIPGGP